tara:strand:- start:2944 stop:3393 length:450 start_codon:yes stop_codon:yes gene_type:complete
MPFAVLSTAYDGGEYVSAHVPADELPAPGMVAYVTAMCDDGFEVTTAYQRYPPAGVLGVITLVPRDGHPRVPRNADVPRSYKLVQVQTDGTLTLSGLQVEPSERQLLVGSSIGWDKDGAVSMDLPGIGYALSRTPTTLRVQLTHPAPTD